MAAQPYYSRALYLSDPIVQGGATFYPWLQYIPFVSLNRSLGLPIFWIQIFWTSAAALGTGLTLYLFLWLVCKNRWLAAAITICIWTDIDLGVVLFAHRPLFVHQIYLVAADFIAHLRGHPLLPRPTFLWQWRIANPALDLPFIFLQLIVTSIARENPTRRSLVLSGLVFALTFYVYFYLWTMIAAGLCIALIVDRPGRRTYLWTLGIGVAFGWPQIAHDYMVRGALPAEGLKFFELMTSSLRSPDIWNDTTYARYAHPYLVIGELVILGGWVIRRNLPALVLAWCMCCAGVGLSVAKFVTGISMHDYHWAWLAVPLMHVVIVAAALDLIVRLKSRPRVPGWVGILLVSAYLAGGIYLIGSIYDVASGSLRDSMTIYSEYNRQRLVPGVSPLKPDSVIACDYEFVDLAAVAERQRPLAGGWIESDMVLSDAERRVRFVLDRYLTGIDRAEFINLFKEYGIPREQLGAYLQTFDEASSDSERLVEHFYVRYLVLPAAQLHPAFLRTGWELIQAGPYWQIWERIEKG
jgi:hypothetical protein